MLRKAGRTVQQKLVNHTQNNSMLTKVSLRQAQVGVNALGVFNPQRSMISNPLEISGLQMNNNMYVTKKVLDR